MKTLYININNEQIQSNDELEVLNYDLDGDFFFYLGDKIAKGCKVENENSLITDYNSQDNEEDYQKIISQCVELKAILFSEERKKNFELILPNSYIHWLRYSEKYNHVYDKNFSHGESVIIPIEIEDLYEESVEDMQRKILRTLKRNDLYLEIDEIVFNDDTITRRSPIISTIKDKYEDIGFKTYKKWLIENEENNNNDKKSICDTSSEKSDLTGHQDEHYFYAIKGKPNRWSRDEKYKFYTSNGQPLDDNEYYLVADGDNVHYSHHVITNLLVIKTKDDPTLYYISPDGVFHRIGEYDYEHGRYYANINRDYYKYDVRIIQNKYILYRKNREYHLFEIKSNYSIKEIATFSSKAQFYSDYIIKNYIVCEEFTFDYKSSDFVKINGYKGCRLIGFYDNEPFFLVSKDWDEEKTDLNTSIVDSKGRIVKRKFGYDSYEYLSDTLLIVYRDDDDNCGIINIKGDEILPCMYKKIEKISNDVCELTTEDYDELYYIVSKDKIVHAYNDDCYVKVLEDGTYKVYSFDTDELINQLTISDDDIVGIWNEIENEYSFTNLYCIEDQGGGELRSLLDNRIIYTFPPTNEELVGANKDKFVVKGDSYIEVYNHQGIMLKCIDLENFMTNFRIYSNGYIAFWDSKRKTTGWFDNDYTTHYASDHIKSDEYLNIKEFTSDNSVIICEEHQTYVICNNKCIYRGYKLEKLDKNNFSGADYNFKDHDNNWCIVDIKNGCIPVHGECGNVYLIK